MCNWLIMAGKKMKKELRKENEKYNEKNVIGFFK
jgi:hypothetical protein